MCEAATEQEYLASVFIFDPQAYICTGCERQELAENQDQAPLPFVFCLLLFALFLFIYV
ncbi:MAG: hypothetical protein IPL27_11910 [Lewinellaceae bacterium]|nr:hypothetical protein [Lewinellaceae bacterium]